MILDSSAIVAILVQEPGFEALEAKIAGAPQIGIGAPTLVETGIAVEAWLRFGKGRHPASLNLGDCMSYAAARRAGRPLLCTGGDFPRTDLPLA